MPILEVTNLRKHFGEVNVLNGVSFELEKGQVLSIIGSSGGGKTTLLRCLNALEVADSGSIAVNGRTIFGLDENGNPCLDREAQLMFGLVFQQFNLFPQYNVLDNLCLAPKLLAKKRPDYKAHKKDISEEIEKTSTDLLRTVGLLEKAAAYPCELSGGQQQRVAIARALALNPEILCFDEPTSALDPELTGEVLRVIRELKSENRTMIIVTHEMEFARNVSDKVIFMANGVIEEMGPPETLFGQPKSERLRAFLNMVQSGN